MPIRNYANVAQPTSLTSDIGINDTTIPVVSTAGYPSAPFTIALERGEPNEEVVLVQGKTGTSFTDCVRGYDGTDKNAHLNTSPVEHVVAALDYREANAHVNDTTGNPHPQYVRSADLEAGVGGFNLAVPVGSLVPYLGTTSPSTKWLIPNGAPVSRSTYAALFALIGTTFGAGDGLSTFNLPDLRGRVLMALDNLGGAQANVVNNASARTLGGTIGSHTSVLTVGQIPSHNHGAGTLQASTGGAHTHGGSTGTAGSHTHQGNPSGNSLITRRTSGGDYDLLIRPAGVGISGVHNAHQDSTTGAAGSHSHSVTINTSGSAHSHTVTGTTASAGASEPVNMLQPSMAVGYLLRALA